MLITWLCQFTKGRDLIRPAITRFAIAYLTLGCLQEQKIPLMNMFNSARWKASRFAGTKEGKRIQSIIMDSGF